MHAASAATIRMRTRSTESHLTISGTLSPSTQQPCKGNATNHRLLARRNHTHAVVQCSAPELDHVPFRMCGCTASFKPGGPRLDVLYTRPVKPRQSGRTILIRNAKQYISFHMPTLTTSKQEAGCCCDAALSQTHYRSTQVNHHELMQRHQCHIRCEDTDSMHACSTV